jgi:hypothetical protein
VLTAILIQVSRVISAGGSGSAIATLSHAGSGDVPLLHLAGVATMPASHDFISLPICVTSLRMI